MNQEKEEIILETRNDLVNYLKETKYEYVILKFHADWCAPCKVIGPKVKNMVLEKAEQLKSHENKFIYIEVDVDECFDLYAFLKSKKMVRGIPTIFLYKKEIYSKSDESQIFIPQSSISGAKEKEIQNLINLIK
jgi:thiol:disulfide interchange protein